MPKLKVVDTKVGKDGEKILVTVPADRDSRPCKQCRKEARANGSSRCAKCSEGYVVHQFNERRLQKKIAATIKNK